MAYNSQYTGAQIDAGVAGGLNAVPASRTVNGKALDADIALGADDVGAAAADHTHAAADVGAAAADHTHTAADVGAAAADHTHTAADVGAAAADHTHTAAQVGAAAANHTHTAAAVGAAAANHTHTAAQVGAAAWNHTHSDLGNARTAFGAYAGTGAYGSGSPVVLTFAFVPRVLVIARAGGRLTPGTQARGSAIKECDFSDSFIILMVGANPAQVSSYSFGVSRYGLLYYSLGTTTSFYTVQETGVGFPPSDATQYNAAGQTYYYFAIG